ncbi:TetR/AcrR family transcriptional regulator [Niallia taxi]|uniref:TetR/AcrR family transcriptional regulator n=1 Tax=Niallia taxi TaxID=2499688 RepID=UPI002E1B3954|nr:TetR/AcrR family transcriptional regulator [Niallia taxi]
MTSNKIKEIALIHFARNGYEGASLAHIAEEVGIKKQSIYTHFKGKDELFLQLCKDTSLYELNTVADYIYKNRNLPVKDILYNLLLHFRDQYEKNEYTKFWLRVSFFPPVHLHEQVMEIVYEYLDKVEGLLQPVFENAQSNGEIHSEVNLSQSTAAYLGILDGVFVEMLYGGPTRLEKRIDHSWYIYWRGISK